MKFLSFSISILSIIIGIIVMVGCYIVYGKVGMLEGVAAWILGPLGAPTTFLCWIVHKIGLDKSNISQYIWICLFYLLQYQLIALFIYSLYIKNIRLISIKSITYLGIISIIIIVSAWIMWNIIMGKW